MTKRTYEQALEYLYSFVDYSLKPSYRYSPEVFNLERVRALLRDMGNPQEQYKSIHVAGTKGKGSVSSMIASILQAAGYRVGLYTSPHLRRLTERIRVDKMEIAEEDLANGVDAIEPHVARIPDLTTFEILTALAFRHFRIQNVECAVVEVGLGGRLDATNVLRPVTTVITSLSYDHTQILGERLSDIAREKAGIIKPGVPVISGVREDEPRRVIRQTCREQGCSLRELGVDFDFDYRPPHEASVAGAAGRIDFHDRTPDGPYALRDVALGLLGRHQGANAAVALAAVRQLQGSGWEIPERSVRGGLAGLAWPARVELVARRPTIVVDAAHNVASAEALVQTLKESFSARRRFLVFAATQDKDVRGMLACLLKEFDDVILTQYLDSPRAMPAEEVAAVARELSGCSYRVCAAPAEAWNEVRGRVGPDDLVCVTGSFFIAAQMRRQIRARPIQPE